MIWMHIIADLKEINFSKLDFDENKISSFFSKIIAKSWLKEVWKTLHTFWKKEITWIFALAESHVSFHTWPEFNYVSVDIFVCNLKQDNSAKAEEIFEKILKYFNCEKYDVKRIERGV